MMKMKPKSFLITDDHHLDTRYTVYVYVFGVIRFILDYSTTKPNLITHIT